MSTPGYVAAVVAKAEAGGVRGAELAALGRRLSQLGEQRAGYLPGEVLETGTADRTPVIMLLIAGGGGGHLHSLDCSGPAPWRAGSFQ